MRQGEFPEAISHEHLCRISPVRHSYGISHGFLTRDSVLFLPATTLLTLLRWFTVSLHIHHYLHYDHNFLPLIEGAFLKITYVQVTQKSESPLSNSFLNIIFFWENRSIPSNTISKLLFPHIMLLPDAFRIKLHRGIHTDQTCAPQQVMVKLYGYW